VLCNEIIKRDSFTNVTQCHIIYAVCYFISRHKTITYWQASASLRRWFLELSGRHLPSHQAICNSTFTLDILGRVGFYFGIVC